MKIITLIFSFFLITDVSAKEEDISTYIKDDHLKTCIINQYNIDHQTERTTLSLDELREIRQLNCSSNMIADATGIDKLVNIVDLNLSNNNISSINVSKNIELKNLELKNNLIENIDFSKNVNLQKLDLSNNKIRSIFLTNNLLLEELDISNNELKELDIKNNLSLIKLSLQNNNFSKEIDSSKPSFHSVVQYNPYFFIKTRGYFLYE